MAKGMARKHILLALAVIGAIVWPGPE
jgi:hypothetical protein